VEQLPHIFKDYGTWPEWTEPRKYNENVHLKGFKLRDLKRMRRLICSEALPLPAGQSTDSQSHLPENPDDLKLYLKKARKEIFEKMTKLKCKEDPSRMDLRVMAELYRKKLLEVWPVSPSSTTIHC
jgi:hypothetical protein